MVSRSAKSSHRVFKHPKLAEHVSLSGADGDDAKNYEEKNVVRAIETRGKQSDRYPLFVSWSDKDQAFIGYCPALFLGGVCHDENRIAAYAKLVEIVEEDIQSRLEKGENLPEPKNDIWFAEAATT
jgi:hypothetical protein